MDDFLENVCIGVDLEGEWQIEPLESVQERLRLD